MREPVQIKIGPIWYTIRWMGDLEAQDADARGIIHYGPQIIRLMTGLQRARLAVTFAHEVMHAINCAYGTTEDKKGRVSEEAATCGFSIGWTAFVQDNPEAAAWYMDLAQRDPQTVYVMEE